MTQPRRLTWRPPDPKPPDSVPVTRAHSRFGNPFKVGDPGVPDNETACRLHRDWLLHSERVIFVTMGKSGFGLRTKSFDPAWQRANLQTLAGRDLACNCLQGDPCHGDTLLELANSPKVEELDGTSHEEMLERIEALEDCAREAKAALNGLHKYFESRLDQLSARLESVANRHNCRMTRREEREALSAELERLSREKPIDPYADYVRDDT